VRKNAQRGHNIHMDAELVHCSHPFHSSKSGRTTQSQRNGHTQCRPRRLAAKHQSLC
jgi:hypothetical protein